MLSTEDSEFLAFLVCLSKIDQTENVERRRARIKSVRLRDKPGDGANGQ